MSIERNPRTGREITRIGPSSLSDTRLPASTAAEGTKEGRTGLISVAQYNNGIAPYTSSFEDDTDFDRRIQNDPKTQFFGAPMTGRVYRKKLPRYGWMDACEALDKKIKTHIPTVGETRDTSSLEAIDTRDLEVGSILVIGTFSTNLGDMRRRDGSGWAYRPICYAFEVTEDRKSNSQLKAKLAKEIKVDSPLFGEPILDFIGGEGLIFNPLIARGIGIQFSDKEKSGSAPTTAPVQHIMVFKDRAEFEKYLIKKQTVSKGEIEKF